MGVHVVLAHNQKLPVNGYGGTERVAWWLARGLSELGVKVTLACAKGSHCPHAEVAHPDFTRSLEAQLPADIFHHFLTPDFAPERPYLVTIHGNGRLGERFLPNTSFLSRDHARRHGADCYVYNGVDPDDYEFRARKEDYLVFLAKASWRVKNVRGAIHYARRSGRKLRIIGGSRWWLPSWRGIRWEGMLAGADKARLVAGARGLIFPVLWNEPFGLAVVEALMSGTPVLASPHGSLPELVPPQVGFLCASDGEFLKGIDRLGEIKAETCREWAMENFHYRKMAAGYLELYRRVLDGERLNTATPRATESHQKYCPIGRA